MKNSQLSALIGIGAMYSWACAIFGWMDWIKSDNTAQHLIGSIGAGVVSLSMAALLIRYGSIETEKESLKRRCKELESECKTNREQADTAIAWLEKERTERNET